MSFSGWHPWIESAQLLSVPKLQSWAILFPGTVRTGMLTWSVNGEEIYKIRYHSELHDEWGNFNVSDDTGTYSIKLSTTPLHFGGRRWWMHCPLTHRRALKLYRYACLGKFCHRMAIRPQPTYASQRVSGLDRIMDRRWALRRKLRDKGTLFDPLEKPKWMRWNTFERYAVKDDYLGALEDATIIQRWGRFI